MKYLIIFFFILVSCDSDKVTKEMIEKCATEKINYKDNLRTFYALENFKFEWIPEKDRAYRKLKKQFKKKYNITGDKQYSKMMERNFLSKYSKKDQEAIELFWDSDRRRSFRNVLKDGLSLKEKRKIPSFDKYFYNCERQSKLAPESFKLKYN